MVRLLELVTDNEEIVTVRRYISLGNLLSSHTKLTSVLISQEERGALVGSAAHVAHLLLSSLNYPSKGEAPPG